MHAAAQLGELLTICSSSCPSGRGYTGHSESATLRRYRPAVSRARWLAAAKNAHGPAATALSCPALPCLVHTLDPPLQPGQVRVVVFPWYLYEMQRLCSGWLQAQTTDCTCTIDYRINIGSLFFFFVFFLVVLLAYHFHFYFRTYLIGSFQYSLNAQIKWKMTFICGMEKLRMR